MKSMGDTLEVEYKFGALQILLKEPFDLNIFLSHIQYGRKTEIRMIYLIY